MLAVGPTGVTAAEDGRLLVTMVARSGCRPTDVYPWWARAQIGKVLATKHGRRTRVVADVNGFECSQNPDGDVTSSYPFTVLADRGRFLIADTGGGSVLELKGSKLRLLGLSVPGFGPTPLALSPDGALYAGVCNCAGQGKVLRIVPGKTPTIVADGFGWIMGLAFGRDGSLYVVDMTFEEDDPTAAHGAVHRIARNGARTTIVPQGRLEHPGQAAWGPDNALYVVNQAQFGVGEVVRIKP